MVHRIDIGVLHVYSRRHYTKHTPQQQVVGLQ